METTEKQTITVQTTVQAAADKVWQYWTTPQHIMQWNNASADWHTPKAENDLRVGGKFVSRMEARDGSLGFDFEGTYDEVVPNQLLAYTMPDGRKASISFEDRDGQTVVTETFDADTTHAIEMQRAGWQAILDNFKKYVESAGEMEKLHFEILIDAPAEKVYRTMLNEKTYPAWTEVFHPGSHFKGSWEKGSKILFLGPDKEGEMGGMVSRIRENIPHEYVSIEHLGLVNKGTEITTGKDVEAWAGAQENYTFKDVDGKTLLLIDTDTNQEYKEMFSQIWPKALEKLKSLCEA